MSEAFHLHRMLEEIVEDEKVGTSKRRKVSQADIRKLLLEKQSDKREDTGAANTPSSTPEPPEGERPPGDSAATDPIHPAPSLTGSGFPESTQNPVDDPQTALPSLSCRRSFLSTGAEGYSNPLGLIPLRIMLKHKIIPVHVENGILYLAMENLDDHETIHEVEILTRKRVEVVKVGQERLNEALRQLESERDSTPFESALSRNPNDNGLLPVLLEMLVIFEGSDLLIAQGVTPRIKTPIHMEDSGLPAVTVMDCFQCAKSLMTEGQWERFLGEGAVVFSWQDPWQGLFRVHVTRERNAPSLVIHRIPATLPNDEEMGLPSWLPELTKASGGLAVIAGPSGSGKTTTLHALAHMINLHRACSIVTVEEPIEYLHRPAMSQICQREVGRDVASLQEGIKNARRQGADVIVVGDPHSPEALMETLAAARAGHLVLTTCEAVNTTTAIEMMIHCIPRSMQSCAKRLMGDTLLSITAQRLLPALNGGGITPVFEKLSWNPRLRDLMHSSPRGDFRDHLQDGTDEFVSFEEEIRRLASKGRISPEHVYSEDLNR